MEPKGTARKASTMQALAILAIIPALEIIIMGAIITRETWIGGKRWPR
jgi:hypothetical protein